jgi:hypothetical protein
VLAPKEELTVPPVKVETKVTVVVKVLEREPRKLEMTSSLGSLVWDVVDPVLRLKRNHSF